MECMRILRNQGPTTFKRLRDEYAAAPDHELDEGHNDDDMNEFLNDWFQDGSKEDNPCKEFLRKEALKNLYDGASTLTRLSATSLILNLQSRYQWSNASMSALLT